VVVHAATTSAKQHTHELRAMCRARTRARTPPHDAPPLDLQRLIIPVLLRALGVHVRVHTGDTHFVAPHVVVRCFRRVERVGFRRRGLTSGRYATALTRRRLGAGLHTTRPHRRGQQLVSKLQHGSRAQSFQPSAAGQRVDANRAGKAGCLTGAAWATQVSRTAHG